MKNVKIVKRKTAIIILIILVILIMLAVFVNVERFYQKEYENFPTITVYYKDKVIGKMLPSTYNWTYNGETKEHNIERLASYDFPEESIILMETNNETDYYLKSDVRYKTTFYSRAVRHLPGNGATVSRDYTDISREFQKGKNIDWFSSVGEYLYSECFTFLKQGNAIYSIKIVTFDGEQARIAKNYVNTQKNDVEKIDELLSKLDYNSLYNSCKIENNNLIVEYDYHIAKESLKMNNLVLFACIPELETVTYSPTNKKTVVDVIEDEYSLKRNEEVDKYVYTREEVNNEDLANIENLKKFMEQI